MTFTKEQLIARAETVLSNARTAADFHDSKPYHLMDIHLAEIALASLEAETAACQHQWRFGGANKLQRQQQCVKCGRVELVAPPAPVSVPDEATPENIEILASTFAPRGVTYQWDRDECNAAADSWNACRAAMLQGAAGNSPAIPDGWVMVPADPTAEMLQSGISAHYERSQTQIHDRPAPGPMECAYVAMLAAAPQQEAE